MPEFCIPEEVRDFYRLKDTFDENKVCSRYGADWAAQVDEICKEVDYYTCKSLKSTVDDELAGMSNTQWEHMFQ